MSRTGGFTTVDVAVDIHVDPKFGRLARAHPDLYAPAFTVFLALLAESWRAGERVSLDRAWPLLMPFDAAVADALREGGLLDGKGCITARAWRSWFTPAFERREKARQSGSRGGQAAHGLPPRTDDAERSDPQATLNRRSGAAQPVPFRSEPVRTDRSEPVSPDRSGPMDGQASEEVESDVV